MSLQSSCREGHVDPLSPKDGMTSRMPSPQAFTTTQAPQLPTEPWGALSPQYCVLLVVCPQAPR